MSLLLLDSDLAAVRVPADAQVDDGSMSADVVVALLTAEVSDGSVTADVRVPQISPVPGRSQRVRVPRAPPGDVRPLWLAFDAVTVGAELTEVVPSLIGAS